jgi:hypothetical protein
MFSSLKKHAMSYGVAIGSVVALAAGSITRAAMDTDISTPLQAFLDYAKENILGVIGIVLLAVGAIFALTLGIKAAMAWLRRAVK